MVMYYLLLVISFDMLHMYLLLRLLLLFAFYQLVHYNSIDKGKRTGISVDSYSNSILPILWSEVMTTLYIDVYFLINFCVDILALYFAASFVKIPCTNLRLVISGVIGGGYAVVGILLLDESYLMYPISAMIFISMVLVILILEIL